MTTWPRQYERPPRSAAEADARSVGARSRTSRHALGEIAARLGHTGIQLHRTKAGRWFTSCDCGFVSTTRNTDQDALGAAVHHVNLAVKAWHRTGLPLPAEPRMVTRPEREMRRTNRHYDAMRRAEESGHAGNVSAAG